jgi:DNA-binding transcriptional LysR family regulator
VSHAKASAPSSAGARMNVQDLRYLSAAADTLNLTRAAGALGLHASTISRRITRLEDELGVTLFERSHQGLRLTKAWRLAMVHVQRALDDIEALIDASHRNGNGLTGRVRLGVRLPPIGEPLRGMLEAWRVTNSNVELAIILGSSARRAP